MKNYANKHKILLDMMEGKDIHVPSVTKDDKKTFPSYYVYPSGDDIYNDEKKQSKVDPK
ncbi:MAG: hypothetical protein ABI315_06380 [Bacteroidia bacterium]